MRRSALRPRTGHGLVLALFVLVIMTTALGLLALSMTMGELEVRREVRTVNLIALSDAAMAETLAHLAVDEDFEGVEERPFGEGVISSEVTALGTHTVQVVANATYAGQERAMRGEVLLTLSGPVVIDWERVGSVVVSD